MTRTEPIYNAIGERLRDAMFEARLNQEQLADRLDVSGSLVNQWVKGARRIQVEDLRRVAAVLEVPVVRLLGEDAAVAEPPPDQDAERRLAKRIVAELTEQLPAIVRAVLTQSDDVARASKQPRKRTLDRQASYRTDSRYLKSGLSAPMDRLVQAAAPLR